jgi:hypothetical protein
MRIIGIKHTISTAVPVYAGIIIAAVAVMSVPGAASTLRPAAMAGSQVTTSMAAGGTGHLGFGPASPGTNGWG